MELETVEDYHIVGFNIDLTQRTITGIQPTQSWKIRDATSAGSKRLTLSGLASRLHTIYAYTFPATAADAAAEQLVHLYVQKGLAASDCKRFLKRSKKTALVLRSSLSLSLCVWHPLFLRVLRVLHFDKAGGLEPICLSSPTKLWHFGGRVV